MRPQKVTRERPQSLLIETAFQRGLRLNLFSRHSILRAEENPVTYNFEFPLESICSQTVFKYAGSEREAGKSSGCATKWLRRIALFAVGMAAPTVAMNFSAGQSAALV